MSVTEDKKFKLYSVLTISMFISACSTCFYLSFIDSENYVLIMSSIIIVTSVGISLSIRALWREFVAVKQFVELMFSMSHQLKTPLTSINMFTEMLALGLYRDDEDYFNCLQTIQTECRRLIDLVDRLLKLHMVESGGLRFERASITDIIIETLKIFNDRSISNKVKLSLDLANDLPLLEIDRVLISDALLNLLDNALKYSLENKEITIRVWKENGYIVISVKDNGIGIPKEHHERLFEPLYRVNDPSLPRIDGNGLGLTFVKSVVQAHKGKIALDSVVGRGSEFRLYLPFERERRS